MALKILTSKFFWGALWLLVMGIIFFFSSFPGSSVYYEPPFWYVIQRKGAHVVEYAVLALVSFRFFTLLFSQETWKRVWLLSLVWTLAFAATDELHQYFTPFRGAHLRDVVIDAFGVGVAFSLLLLYRACKKKQN
jgi:VanZ family protein